MRIKHFWIIAVSMVFLTGLKNVDYYTKHLKEAHKKNDTCVEMKTEFAKAGNLEKLELLVNDKECRAAKKAVSNAKYQQRKERAKARQAMEADFLERVYTQFEKIPIEKRLVKSPESQRWKKACEKDKHITAILMLYACKLDTAGQKVYTRAMKKYSVPSSTRDALYRKCQGLARDSKYRAALERRPVGLAVANGAHECHAIFDIVKK